MTVTVESHYGAYILTNDDGRTMLWQGMDAEHLESQHPNIEDGDEIEISDEYDEYFE